MTSLLKFTYLIVPHLTLIFLIACTGFGEYMDRDTNLVPRAKILGWMGRTTSGWDRLHNPYQHGMAISSYIVPYVHRLIYSIPMALVYGHTNPITPTAPNTLDVDVEEIREIVEIVL
jgi:hypothetical protein